jgi:hypothetical protein
MHDLLLKFPLKDLNKTVTIYISDIYKKFIRVFCHGFEMVVEEKFVFEKD